MLKLSVGYQPLDQRSFADTVRRYRDAITEVYFAWVDQPSGRSSIGGFDGYFDYSLQEKMVKELSEIRGMGIKLDLLFNANCYGEDAMSERLLGNVSGILSYLDEISLYPDTVTTASPAIAYMIKENFEEISLKASVNMKIGTVKGMQYTSHLFDEYCVEKECNRDLERLAALKKWADENGKKLTMLANSGCMRNCSGQIFHDNMVAHEDGISAHKNIDFLPYMCWNYLKDRSHFASVLQNTWVRPEDVDRYEGLVDTVKLATRAHAQPEMVIGAYTKRRYVGNLLDLFEPGFSPAFAPYVINAAKLPADFFDRTTKCDKNCENCTYCESALADALTKDDSFGM